MADFENGLPPITNGSEGKISGLAINKSKPNDSEGKISSLAINKSKPNDSDDLAIKNISIRKYKIDKIEDVISYIQSIAIKKEDIGMTVGGFI